MPKIQDHIANLRPSDTLSINEYSATLQKQGRKIVRFGFGQSPFPVPEIVQESLRRNAHQKDYLPVQGLAELREKVAQHTNALLGQNLYQADQIFIGPGSKQLIYLLQLAHDGPLILPNPSWVSYAPQATILKKKIYWVDCDSQTWLLSANQLEEKIVEFSLQGGLLILNYPNNPTGQLYSDGQLQELAVVCRQYDITVIADEIYGILNFGDQYSSMAAYYPEGTLITSGLSKWCGAGGWRLGTMTFPRGYEKLYETLRVLSSETFSSVSAPVQHAGVVAYSGHGSIVQYIARSRAILHRIAQYAYEQLSEAHVRMPMAQGGFYMFPEFRSEEILNSVELCKQLLDQCGVALLPGSSFGRPTNELTARLAYVDFDGTQALEYLDREKHINTDAFEVLFPNIVRGIQKLKSWVVDHQSVRLT